MDLGVTMFFTDRSIGPVELARAAEERGFSSLFVPEHTHIPTSRATAAPMGEPLPEQYRRTLDPFVALTAAATATTRLRVGTGIALVAQRDPIVTAKEVATLDLLSGGRFTFGVGFGWNLDELAHHGVAAADRRAVVRERVLAMQRLWADDEASFDGHHVRFGPAWAWPKPVQRPWPPVLIGGAGGPVLFDHITEYADGWIPIGGRGTTGGIADLRRRFEEVGRDPATLQVVPLGTMPDEAKLAHLASLGITECVLDLPSGPPEEVLPVLDAHARYLA
ncbi:LLM class F420-dependent oxidoreductase [soil metagenome]